MAALSVLSLQAGAHGGGLNADGCHVNRKTGDYHCHRSPAKAPAASDAYAAAQNLAPAHSSASGTTRNQGAFANCAAARAAGAAPVRIGEPGYGPHLDRDGDGIGCEPYRGRR
ncbi:excalibur calcium-binding domain-containing protein [Massilia sp. IC2-477]|uniref:excalibur calcium-binding domain-containing protein n=1 Tax=Massilia sp. IC2-477 TaxID=2887198 RepID=UPI001D1049C1|nr:excalibur calcium-binding domain-containing protein [Massilia sp. IC2-477]MCC2956495.1 excalibur calcium-binding domain-containing protein [Massilia sp. IC2-477]